jgi:hypothetical protein
MAAISRRDVEVVLPKRWLIVESPLISLAGVATRTTGEFGPQRGGYLFTIDR